MCHCSVNKEEHNRMATNDRIGQDDVGCVRVMRVFNLLLTINNEKGCLILFLVILPASVERQEYHLARNLVTSSNSPLIISVDTKFKNLSSHRNKIIHHQIINFY